jgi:flagellar hook-associated protein 1 FlgK
MSITGILNIGKTLLMASQAQLGVTSHNIANANTPGYSRQEVILEISTPITLPQGFAGRGVSVAGVKRYYDSFISSQIVGNQQDYGKSYTLSQTLAGVEQLFNEAQNLGLASPLTDYFNAWQGVASNPEGLTERNLLLQKSEALVLSAQRMEQGLTGILKHTEDGIADSTGQINALASQIARLNDQIIQVQDGPTGYAANDLRDQRDGLLKDLGNLVELSAREEDDGSLTVTIGMRNLVSGNTANSLSAVYNREGNFSLQLEGEDITSRITKGELGGLLAARQEITGTFLYELRKLMATLTYTVNFQHGQGFGLDGSTSNNFFNPIEFTVRNYSAGAALTVSIPANTDPSELILDEYTVNFNGLNYEIYNSKTGLLKTSGVYDPTGTTVNLEGVRFEISGAVSDRDSFQVSPLKTAVSNFGTAVTSAQAIAASGTLAGLPGDNTNALTLAGLLDSQMTSLNSGNFTDFYRSLISRICTDSRAASDELKFMDNFLAELNTRRESVSGVNLDDEAANLLRFQRAYEAGARLIKTADEIFQTLLSILNN